MANINLRLYGDQIYPNISKYLTEYIIPEIQKEDFLNKYKDGLVEIKNMSLKQKIKLPSIRIESISIEEIKLNIPNEKENFSIYLNNMKCLLELSEIKENEVKEILIENKKKLIEDFMKYSISKIEKKDGASFLDNLIKSFIDKIINGLTIEINNLELTIRTDKGKNTNFVFLIENLNYSDEKEIKIKNISLVYNENKNKINAIQKFDFIIEIIHSKEEGKPNSLNLLISDFKFELNRNIYFEFLNYYNIFDNAQYKKIYVKYKNLIQYHRPKDEKKDYKLLWYYAIKTIIKLNKYIKYNKQDIFDLLESSQIKIIKKYLEDEKNIENFLLPDEKNTLKATKEKVEKKVLENKKGNVLANAFNFFFGAKKEEEKNDELTEEEKEIFEDIYKDQNIINYINGEKIENKNTSLSSVFENIKKFLSKDRKSTRLNTSISNLMPREARASSVSQYG